MNLSLLVLKFSCSDLYSRLPLEKSSSGRIPGDPCFVVRYGPAPAAVCLYLHLPHFPFSVFSFPEVPKAVIVVQYVQSGFPLRCRTLTWLSSNCTQARHPLRRLSQQSLCRLAAELP